MRPQFTSPDAHSSSPAFSSSSSSSSSDRRINALVRHLYSSAMDPNNNSSISASPTSAHANSVFAHVVRAPEDPILGVLSLSSSLLDICVNVCMRFQMFICFVLILVLIKLNSFGDWFIWMLTVFWLFVPKSLEIFDFNRFSVFWSFAWCWSWFMCHACNWFSDLVDHAWFCLPDFLNMFIWFSWSNKQVTVAYNKDPSPAKLNLGVGAYRTEVSLLWTEFNYCFVIFCVSSDKCLF